MSETRFCTTSVNSDSQHARLTVTPLAGRIGAVIEGVRLSADLPSDIFSHIEDLLYKHKVIFFRGQQHLDEGGQEALGRRFGELVPHPTVPSLKGTSGVLDLDSARGTRAASWHTDVTFVPDYPRISILRGVVIPAVGGDTAWANTATAYNDLPVPLRNLADQLWAVHTNNHDYAARRSQVPDSAREYHRVFTSTSYRTLHPVVRKHPITGEANLVLGHFFQKFDGLNSSDSRHLFEIFQSHITSLDNTVRWKWSEGDIAIWDNQATQHRAVDDYGSQPRIVRRVTVRGDVPVSLDGRSSRAAPVD